MDPVFQKKIRSPAKINLHLAVGEKRADGFHHIESIFVPVSLYDPLDFWCSPSAAFSVTIRGMESGAFSPPKGEPPLIPSSSGQRKASAGPDSVPLEQNLMYRAALLFCRKTGLMVSLRITIEKHIPQGAGLGGGSSNAAAILNLLNEAAGFPLPHDALMETAARLGSDVPFFIETQTAKGKAAFVTGRGEKVVPFDLAGDLFFVLVKPAFASETAEAYRLLDKRRSALREPVPQDSTARDPVPRAYPPHDPVPPETLIAAIEKPPSEWPYRNDFQSVFLDDRYPYSGAYRELFSRLQETGAQFTLLSGSGSTVFGVYESAAAAEAAAKQLGTGHWGTPPLETRPPLVRHCAAIRCN